MTIELKAGVLDTLQDIGEFIDNINTPGAGEFWIRNFVGNLHSYAKPNVTYALCNHTVFAKDGLSCITYNGWVIAFKIKDDTMIIYNIVRGNILI